MKISCGIDMIEIDRIKEAIEKNGEKFINEIYTPNEIAYCESTRNAKYEHYAARFAAKEAAFKAVARFLTNKYEISWKNAEVVNNENGKPELKWKDVSFPEIQSMDISITHCKKYAVANVSILY